MKTITISKDKKTIETKEEEDIVKFIKGALTGTGQKEYYNTRKEQRKALLEIHEPILNKYRKFYSFMLLSQINDLNKQIIIYHLLKHGKAVEQKAIEDKIILYTLDNIKTSRAYKTLAQLAENKVNNNRTKNIVRKWLRSRKNYKYEFLKYKDKVKKIVVHNHLYEDNEIWDFLFNKKKEGYKDDLLNNYFKAKTDKEVIYELPYSIAEGFASYHKIDRKEFLENIKGKMTDTEKLRMQTATKKEGVKVEANWMKWELNKIYKYLYSLDRIPSKASETIENIAKKEADKIPYRFGKSVIIIDNSGSSYGSNEKKYHPISISMAMSKVIEQLSESYEVIYTNAKGNKAIPKVDGATDLASPLIEALKKEPDSVFLLTDGYENQVAGLVSQVVNAYHGIDGKAMIFQLSPVFAAESHSTRELSSDIPNMGIMSEKQLSGGLLLLSIQEDKEKTLKQFVDFLETKVSSISLDYKNYLLPG